jgi:CBS domain containing-hemolysin-like protein
MKSEIDRPLAAILTLNTISHTIGAAGVGAQATVVFNGWVGATSAVLTLIILVFSEIMPKTIGAMHAKRLAVLAVWVIDAMIFVTYPVVVALEVFGRLFKGKKPHGGPTREEIMIMAEMARVGGSLGPSESAVIANMLRMREIRVEEVMTPRTVVFMLEAGKTVAEALADHPRLRFSRIPIMGEGPDDLKGIVLRTDMYEAMAAGRGEATLESLRRDLHAVPETATLMSVLERFSASGHHVFLVVDEYGGTSGVIALEDVVETMLGSEIVDETDPAPDMRRLARRAQRRREAMEKRERAGGRKAERKKKPREK